MLSPLSLSFVLSMHISGRVVLSNGQRTPKTVLVTFPAILGLK